MLKGADKREELGKKNPNQIKNRIIPIITTKLHLNIFFILSTYQFRVVGSRKSEVGSPKSEARVILPGFYKVIPRKGIFSGNPH